MKIWVYTISWNEAVMMPFFLRHYAPWVDKIIVWDEQSDDGTRELVQACQKAELREWPGRGMDDDLFLKAYDEWTMEAAGHADWVFTPDVDELLYHPQPRQVLLEARADVLPAFGLALIGNGPVPTGAGQLYEQIRTGYPQANYTKWIIRRSHIRVRHTHGRHDLPRECSGRIERVPHFKLLHCHYFSPQYTLTRNRRNYDRNVDKRFAWNYTADPEARKWRGTHTWVQDLIERQKLFNVI